MTLRGRQWGTFAERAVVAVVVRWCRRMESCRVGRREEKDIREWMEWYMVEGWEFLACFVL